MGEHTLTNTESENSASFVFTTVRPNTGIRWSQATITTKKKQLKTTMQSV